MWSIAALVWSLGACGERAGGSTCRLGQGHCGVRAITETSDLVRFDSQFHASNLDVMIDFDGDGGSDLLVAGPDGLYVVGAGRLGDLSAGEPLIGGAVDRGVDVALDADAAFDLGVIAHDSSGAGWLHIFYGPMGSAVGPADVELDLPGVLGLSAPGDVDGDRLGDLVVTGGSDGTAGVWSSADGWQALDVSAGFPYGPGDIDGDGLNDLLVEDAFEQSAAVLHYGPLDDWESGGISIDGVSGAATGSGDIDGDGRADLVVGANTESKVGVITEPPAADGEFGTMASSILEATTRSDLAVDIAGDLDDDGHADLVIGAPWTEDNAGAAYIVMGPQEGTKPIPETALLTLVGEAEQTTGVVVLGAGDVDADGWPDLWVSTNDGGMDVENRTELRLWRLGG